MTQTTHTLVLLILIFFKKFGLIPVVFYFLFRTVVKVLLDSEYSEDLLEHLYIEKRGNDWVVVNGMRDFIRLMPGISLLTSSFFLIILLFI